MKERVSRNWLYALLTFFILVLASPPFLEVYQLDNSPFFFLILGAVCLITLLFKQFLITFPLYLISYFGLLYSYFPLGQSPSLRWFSTFFDEFLLLYNQILSGELSYMPQIVALVIILFFLIALAVLMIHYERLWLSYLLIVGYQLLLVAFNQLQLGVPLLLITILTLLFHQLKQLPATLSFPQKSRSFFLTMLVLGLLAGTAYSFQQLVPQARNFLFLQTGSIREYFNGLGLYQHIAQYGQTGLSKSGFSENDQQLGGPLLDDTTVVFTALQSSPHYWRIETKDSYTGKGWESFSSSLHFIGNQEGLVLEDTDYLGSLSPETTITMTFTDAVTYLPQPYGRVFLPLDRIGGAEEIIEKNRINLKEAPKELQLFWQEPAYEESDLLQLPFPNYDLNDWQAFENREVNAQDFFLPTSISERTYQLASQLTHDKATLYEKVKAVEEYLKTNEAFRYSKTDTVYPPTEQDYVDHFLFDSKIGYCDNFSTAMVVLLRSQGIPSRWAKGFAPGELTGEADGYQEYTIRNSHAHSWPEVYFDGYGWIPFEPTPSFNNPDTPATPSTENSTSFEASESSTAISTNQTQEASSSPSTDEDNTNEQSAAATIDWRSILKWGSGIVSFLLIVFGIYFLHKYFFLLRYRLYRKIKPADFNGAYLLLLKQVEKRSSRAADEPLDRYAQRMEKENPSFSGDFLALTMLYEAVTYGKKSIDQADWSSLLDQLAERLMASSKNQQ